MKRARRARTGRRVGLVVLGAVCVAALTGLLGPLEATKSHSSDNGELEVTYPQVVRPGVEFSMTAQVKTPREHGGFSLSLDQTVFEELQVDWISPLPQSQISDGDRVVLAFQSTGGEATVLFRGRIPTQSTFTINESTMAFGATRGTTNEGVDMKIWVLP